MPGLFSRRRSSASNHVPLDRSYYSNASAAAASQAYLQRQSSSTSLSSAAAAAALRSLTTTPEPVGNIQTKRMSRRGSVSSIGSGSVMGSGGYGPPGRAGLVRRDSNSSMVDRTFRSPSPGGRSNGRASPAPAAWDAPPVPKLPKTLRKGHQRSSSVDPPPRVTSPTPPKGMRAASVDRANLPLAGRPPPKKRLSNVAEMKELEESDGRRSSINFSRPIPSPQSSPVTATPPHSFTHGQGSWFSKAGGSGTQARNNGRPSTADSNAAISASSMRQKIQDAATKPVSKNQVPQRGEGSFLAKKNAANAAIRTQPQPEPEETMEKIMVFDSNSRTFVPKLVPKKIQPTSPTLPKAAPLKPGTYDPSTRTIVPPSQPPSAPSSRASSRPTTPASEQQKRLQPVVPPIKTSPAQSSSPASVRASGALQKQPSIVREDPEGEAKANTSTASKSNGKMIATSEGPAKAYIAPNRSLSPSLSPSRGRGNGRMASLSPHRARFSATPVIDTTVHVPPGRGVSPVKSAMKNSPASSIRTSSPMANFPPSGSTVSPSDASDTTSLTSQDGIAKKKKSVRVSFDEHAQSTPPVVAATPSPKPTARAVSPAVADDMDEIMTPRPALPSFGSVRKNRPSPEVVEKVTEMPPERTEMSSDHAVGAVLAAKQNGNIQPDAPVVTSKEQAGDLSDTEDEREKIKTTTVKTRDFAADPAKPSSPDAEKNDTPTINLMPPTPGLDESNKELGDESEDGAEKPKSSMDGIDVPGGWNKDGESDSKTAAPVTLPQVTAISSLSDDSDDDLPIDGPPPVQVMDAINEDSDGSEAFSDAPEDQSELEDGGFASLNAIAVSPPPVVAEKMTPMSPSRPLSTVSPPESPSTQQAERLFQKAHKTGGSGDWTEATAYWSKLSKTQRQQIEREHVNSDVEGTPEKKTPLKSALKKSTASPGPALAPSPQIVKSSPGGTTQPVKSALKKTMRAQPESAPGSAPADGAVHMRKSLRGPGNGGMMTTMRDGLPSSKPRPKSEMMGAGINLPKPDPRRPVSSQGLPSPDSPPVRLPQGSAFPFFQPKQPVVPMQAVPPAKKTTQPAPASKMSKQLQKELANDSDSESSFKKKRRPSTSTVDGSGRYNMKRSMRSNSVDQASLPGRPMSPSKELGMRSLSPAGSMFTRKPEKLRESLRSRSQDPSAGRRTLRSTPGRGPAPRAAPASSRSSKFKSRFNDSDDDEPSQSFFSSRFADSDDEDEGPRFIAADLTPVRGIPRRQGQNDGDSTDLDDSEDEDPRKASRNRKKQSKPMVPDPADVEKAMEAARKKLGIPAVDANGREGNILQKGSLRASQDVQSRADAQPDMVKKKRSFMGNVFRRNRGSSFSIPQVAPQSPIAQVGTQETPGSPSSPLSKKLLRRNSHQTPPKLTRGDSNYSTMTAPPDMAPSSWPLDAPPVPAIPATNGTPKVNGTRPMTADGVSIEAIRLARSMRPPMQARTASGQQIGGGGSRVRIMGPDEDTASVPGEAPEEEPKSPLSTRTGKKKKFGMLRKAFRLDD